MFVREKCVLFFEKSEVIFTKWCFIFVLFFDKSGWDHWFCKWMSPGGFINHSVNVVINCVFSAANNPLNSEPECPFSIFCLQTYFYFSVIEMEDDTCELTHEAVSKLDGPNRWSKTRIVLNHFQGCPFSCVLFQKKERYENQFLW